jgi:hypothetical protein
VTTTDATRRRLERALFFAIFELRRLREKHGRTTEDLEEPAGWHSPLRQSKSPPPRPGARRPAPMHARLSRADGLGNNDNDDGGTTIIATSAARASAWDDSGAASSSTGATQISAGAIVERLDEIMLSQQLLLAKLQDKRD